MKKFFLILLLLAACQFASQTKIPQLPEINTGTSAVEVSVPSLPDIFMCQESDIVVGLKNAGASDAQGSYNFIFEENIMKPLSAKNGKFPLLKGRSLINPVGEYNQVVLKVASSPLEGAAQSRQTPVIFQACYDYETLASVPVCIDPDVRNINKNKICNAHLVSLSGGQGAPVAVTSVEPIMTPTGDQVQPGFIIKLRNLGVGTVFGNKVLAEAACSGGAGEFTGIVDLEAELQGVKLVCKPGFFTLDPNADTEIGCTSELPYGLAQGTFSSVLSIKLDYGYINTVNMPVTIKRLPGRIDCSVK